MSYLNKKTIRDIDVSGKKVIVRVDYNVPLKDGVITSDARIIAPMPTVKYLLDKGAAVILVAHLGRPKGVPNPEFSLRPVAVRLAELLGRPVDFVADCIGEEVEAKAAALQSGQVLLLENLRFYKEEEKNDLQFAASLAKLADIYVDDAFGCAHRAHASTAGITQYLPSVEGFLIEEEIKGLAPAVQDPKRPFVVILGGAKVSDKIFLIEGFLQKVDLLLIGGGMANAFLAAKGHNLQASKLEKDQLEWATNLLSGEAASKIILPVDLVVASAFAPDAEHKVVDLDSIPADWMALDIGPKTIALFEEKIKGSATIVWNGPLGVFEMDAFAAGTTSIAHAVADNSGFSIIGGGDSISAVTKAGVAEQISHISTGGGASLEFLAGNILPGVDSLNDK